MMRRAAFLVCLLAALAVPAAAQKRDGGPGIVQRLMNEPISLFDWGLAQLDRDMSRAATRLFPHRNPNTAPRTGSIYRWRDDRLTLYLSVSQPPGFRTRDACRDLFERVVRDLLTGTPRGKDAAGWYLLDAFKPKAHYFGNRFEDMGAQLAEVVRLEISLIPPTINATAGDTHRVRCTGRLDAAPDTLAYDETS